MVEAYDIHKERIIAREDINHKQEEEDSNLVVPLAAFDILHRMVMQLEGAYVGEVVKNRLQRLEVATLVGEESEALKVGLGVKLVL